MALSSFSTSGTPRYPYSPLILIENYLLFQTQIKHLFLCKTFPDPATVRQLLCPYDHHTKTYTYYRINHSLILFILYLSILSNNGALLRKGLIQPFTSIHSP